MGANSFLVRYAGGWAERKSASYIGAYGRLEALLGLGAVSSLAEVNRVADGQLADFQQPREQTDILIDPRYNSEAPYIGFQVGDTITVAGDDHRVLALSVTEDQATDRVIFVPTLNENLVLNADERVAQALNKMVRGTLGGRSKVAQPVVPAFIPKGRPSGTGIVGFSAYQNGVRFLHTTITNEQELGTKAGLNLQRVTAGNDIRVDDFEYGPLSGSVDVRSESFNKADGALGPDLTWTTLSLFGALVVSSNTCAISAGTTGGAVAQEETSSSSMYVQATISALTVTNFWTLALYGAVDSVSSTPTSGYSLWIIGDSSSNGFVIFVFDNATGDHVIDMTAPESLTFAPGDVIRFEIE